MSKSKFTMMLALACIALTLSFAQDRNPVQEPPLITLGQLSRSDLDDGTFRIEGYVIQIYRCPSCPEGAQCKPCLGDHLVITDNPDEKDPALLRRLRIFAKRAALQTIEVAIVDDSHRGWKPQVGKYSFLIKVRGRLHEGKPLEEADLISAVPLKTKAKP